MIPAFYSLIQYCPDQSRAEVANVGVLVFCPQARFLEARTSAGNDRISKYFGRASFDKVRLNSAKAGLEDRLQLERDRIQSIEDLSRFIDTRANQLRITSPRSMMVENPAGSLDQLFKEFIGGRSRREPKSPLVPELDSPLRTLARSGSVSLDLKVEIPLVGKILPIPYAYRNGRLNLILPKRFACDADTAMKKAMELAVEGDQLASNPQDNETRKLIVVSVFEGLPKRELELHLAALLEKYNTELIPARRVSELVARVRNDAH